MSKLSLSRIERALTYLTRHELIALRCAIDSELAKSANLLLGESQLVGIGTPVQDIARDAWNRGSVAMLEQCTGLINTQQALSNLTTRLRELRHTVAVCEATGNGQLLKGALIAAYDPLTGARKRYMDTVRDFFPDLLNSAELQKFIGDIDSILQFIRHVQQDDVSAILAETQTLFERLNLLDETFFDQHVKRLTQYMDRGGQPKQTFTVYIAQQAVQLRGNGRDWSEIAQQIMNDAVTSDNPMAKQAAQQIEKRDYPKRGEYVRVTHKSIYQ